MLFFALSFLVSQLCTFPFGVLTFGFLQVILTNGGAYASFARSSTAQNKDITSRESWTN